jgi:hypothetical protein
MISAQTRSAFVARENRRYFSGSCLAAVQVERIGFEALDRAAKSR